MTSDQPQPAVNLTVGFGTAIQTGPDGKQWVTLHVSQGTVGVVVAMTSEGADLAAGTLPDALREAAKLARRQNGEGGTLVTADATTIARLNRATRRQNRGASS